MHPDAQRGTIEAILLGVRSLLVNGVSWATEDTVIVADEPNESTATPSDRWIVVTPSPDEMFDAAAFVGGGNDQLTISTRVIVTLHLGANFNDDPGRSLRFFASDGNNINAMRRDILLALSGAMIYDDEDEPVINEPIRPAQGSWVRSKSGGSWQGGFDVEYDEDMESPSQSDVTLPSD